MMGPSSGLWQGALLLLLYVASGLLGLSLASFGDQVTLLWAPSGLAIGALVVGGPRLWPAVWLGSLLVNMWAGAPPWACALIATGNTLEAVVGRAALARVGVDPSLQTPRDVGWFLALAAVGCTTVAATVGSATLVAAGLAAGAEWPQAWLIWWAGDATGVLAVAPMILSLRRWPSGHARREAVVMLALVQVAAALVFLTRGPHTMPLATVPFTLVLVGAVRHGLPVSSAMLGSTGGWAVLGAFFGAGPFVSDLGPDLAQTWAYLAVLGGSMLLVASLQAQRDLAEIHRRRLETSALSAQHLEGLGLIAAGVAHDFNNLLQVIRGNMDLARGAPGGDHLQRADEAVSRAADLCDQLLTYAGEAHGEPEPLSVDDELQRIGGLLHAALPAGITLEVLVDHAVRVHGDRSQLHQVVLNLVSNAAEALTRSGGRRIEIRAGAARIDDAVLRGAQVVGPDTRAGRFGWLEVRDDGPGIDPETLDRLFDPFFTTRFEGRGLGLATVAGIVRSHDGLITVDSAPGRGTGVRVWLPWTNQALATVEPPPPRRVAPSRAARVLVVDDDDAVRRLTVRVLQRAGYDVVDASSGTEALERCTEPAIAVVVLDYTMPDLDGAETLRRLRALRPALPVVMCSGLSAAEARAGANAFLHKPFGADDLVDTVQALCVSDSIASRSQPSNERVVATDDCAQSGEAQGTSVVPGTSTVSLWPPR